MQKLWWVFFWNWVASNVANTQVDYPPALAVQAGIDLVSLALAIGIMIHQRLRVTLSLVATLYLLLLACHAAWSLAIYTKVNPILTSTNYYYQLTINILTGAQLLIFGGTCVPRVIGRVRDYFSPMRGLIPSAGGGK
jgi:hypothetical protein